jgi:hypothetical protein
MIQEHVPLTERMVDASSVTHDNGGSPFSAQKFLSNFDK